MWITNKEYNELVTMVKNYKALANDYYEINIRDQIELERTRKMLWNLQTECDEKDIYRKLGHKSQLSRALKLKNEELLKDNKDLLKKLSEVENEREIAQKEATKYYNEKNDLEIKNKNQKETIQHYADIIYDTTQENKQLKEKNNEQSELIVKQLRKLQKQETPDPLNGETLGAFYD